MASGARLMGRPREFCLETALERALVVFWRHGFEGASMTELTLAMGITRPSLYASFGNKEQLFRKALDLYDRRYMGFVREALDEPSSRQVVERLLLGMVETATDAEHPGGCLVTNGALACSAAAEPIKTEVKRRRALFETVLRGRLEQAKSAHDLPSETDPDDLARFVMTLAGGVALQAACGASRTSLMRTVQFALRAWPSATRQSSGRLNVERVGPRP